MEKNQPLENALKIADMDYNHILSTINNEFEGSIDLYSNYLNQLSNEFETAFAMLMLNSTYDKIKTFITVNQSRIDMAIRTIEIFKEYSEKYVMELASDSVSEEIVDEMLQVQDAHLSQLRYIEKLFNSVLNDINGDSKPTETINGSHPINVESKAETKELLSEYGEFLTMKDMESIFKVRRNAIYNYEKEGHFSRISALNKSVIFKKEDIARYLTSRK